MARQPAAARGLLTKPSIRADSTTEMKQNEDEFNCHTRNGPDGERVRMAVGAGVIAFGGVIFLFALGAVLPSIPARLALGGVVIWLSQWSWLKNCAKRNPVAPKKR